VKENQENDKIGSKPNKNKKCGEAGKSLKQLQLKEEEKSKKTKKEWPKTHTRIKSEDGNPARANDKQALGRLKPKRNQVQPKTKAQSALCTLREYKYLSPLLEKGCHRVCDRRQSLALDSVLQVSQTFAILVVIEVRTEHLLDDMDNPNITMEEYIRLREEKGRRHGKVYNWETDKYAIVYNDALTSKSDSSTEPVKIPHHIDEFDLKTETSISECDEEEQNVVYFNDLFPFNIIYPDDLESNKDNDDEIDILQSLEGGARRSMTWRQFILALGFHTTEEMAEDKFEAYWFGRLFKSRSILYIHQRSAAEDVPQVNLIQHAEGRKSSSKLSGGHFIWRLARHFGLVSDDGLRRLSVVTRELPVIDMGKLIKLNICMEVGDDWTWVAHGTKRQLVAAAATPKGTEDALDVDEGAQAVPAPVHAPLPPPSAAGQIMP
nr:hypothetical protein [Tanacetum cinerariifolium]